MKNTIIFIILAILILVGFVWYKQQAPETMAKTEGQTMTMDNGLIITDTVLGTGKEVLAGNAVSVHYTGRLEDGTKFDSSLDRNQPFVFMLGRHAVIEGWEQGILGMKVGGKRTLTIPAPLAYGDTGAGDGLIPPGATLIFDIELLDTATQAELEAMQQQQQQQSAGQ